MAKDTFESEDAPANPFEVKGLSTSRYEKLGKHDSGADDVFDRSPIEQYPKTDRG